MNSYNLSRFLFDYSFEYAGRIKPNHIAVYFFAIEHCNRLGWKEQFGFPTSMVMEAVGISSYNTFIKVLNELVEYGFIEMIQKSKNQYQSNIIALSNFDKALDKALDKSILNHLTNQDESTEQSSVQISDSINKQQTNKPINNKQQTIDSSSSNFSNENNLVKTQEEKKEKSSAKKEKAEMPFPSKEFDAQWTLWKMYRKKNHKFQFVNIASEQRELSKLKNESGNDEKTAIAMITQSIDKGWKGFFPLKNKTEKLQTSSQGEFNIFG
ncbi:Uncharacterised protein [Algoriella xinjiangensis]|uniref:hypothetical protein n=1 Tax=Algoriella xinjiangensis TaxID=684065 RepID=UPI000F6442CD|nr:hypothetical protein [Algoriella xinjiangensis]VDH16730.1 Uncharacterised protein [Algoriella xinjiangensis]